MEQPEPHIDADAGESSDAPREPDMAGTVRESGGCSARPGAMDRGWLLGLLGLGLVLAFRRAPGRA